MNKAIRFGTPQENKTIEWRRPNSRTELWPRIRKILGRASITLSTLVVILVALLPVLWVYRTSFMDRRTAFLMPPRIISNPTLENFRIVLEKPGFLTAIGNSIIVSSTTTFLSLFIGSFAAYALSRWRSRASETLTLGILGARMIPTFSLMLPYFLLVRRLGIADTHLGLIVSYLSFNLPFAIWILRGFMDSIPFEMDECAMIDGASRFVSLTRIILPMAGPGLASTAILSFMLSWNEFLLALIVTSLNAVTAPVMLLSFITPEGIEWGPVSAAAAIVMTPMILVYLFLRRSLIRGFSEGALKG